MRARKRGTFECPLARLSAARVLADSGADVHHCERERERERARVLDREREREREKGTRKCGIFVPRRVFILSALAPVVRAGVRQTRERFFFSKYSRRCRQVKEELSTQCVFCIYILLRLLFAVSRAVGRVPLDRSASARSNWCVYYYIRRAASVRA